jgi:hypothetical protein
MVCVHTVPARPLLALPIAVCVQVSPQHYTCVSLLREREASLCSLASSTMPTSCLSARWRRPYTPSRGY